MTKRILLVCMPDSVHVGRWLELHKREKYSVYIFPSSPMRGMHAKLSELLAPSSEQEIVITFPKILRFLALPMWFLDRRFGFNNRVRAFYISNLIKKWKPDLVHIMETQNGGYPTSIALNSLKLGDRPKVLLTLFGSDIFWFGKFPSHKLRIQNLLSQTDYLAVECVRDERLARGLGYRGAVLPPAPVGGGLRPDLIAKPDSKDSLLRRKIIAVKGYGGKWGQVNIALEALAKVPLDVLADFEVFVFSAERKARRPAHRLRSLGVPVTVSPKFALDHADVLDLMRKSRVYLGISRSDGLPASLLEAMSQGVFPIQTSTSCLESWIINGKSGFVIDSVEISNIAHKIEVALKEDNLLLKAQKINLKTIEDRYSLDSLKSQVIKVYLTALA